MRIQFPDGLPALGREQFSMCDQLDPLIIGIQSGVRQAGDIATFGFQVAVRYQAMKMTATPILVVNGWQPGKEAICQRQSLDDVYVGASSVTGEPVGAFVGVQLALFLGNGAELLALLEPIVLEVRAKDRTPVYRAHKIGDPI